MGHPADASAPEITQRLLQTPYCVCPMHSSHLFWPWNNTAQCDSLGLILHRASTWMSMTPGSCYGFPSSRSHRNVFRRRLSCCHGIKRAALFRTFSPSCSRPGHHFQQTLNFAPKMPPRCIVLHVGCPYFLFPCATVRCSGVCLPPVKNLSSWCFKGFSRPVHLHSDLLSLLGHSETVKHV